MSKVKIQEADLVIRNNDSFFKIVRRDLKRNKYIYIMAIPVLLFYLIFHYAPMYGAIIAFKDYSPASGILGSSWVGFKHFLSFFDSIYLWRVIRNTLLISAYQLVFGFPAPIILALLLNEVKNRIFKSTVQTVVYLPHFISLVVVTGLISQFAASNGFINDIIVALGGERTPLLSEPGLFRTIYVSSGVWQEIGWNTIIYLAALAGIDQQQYEAAKIDGAGRFRQIISVTIPGIMPTIVILLILRLGQLMGVGFEKIILLYNPTTYETADVISSFVYRRGLQEFNWSFAAAVGLFNSVINFIMVILANKISRVVAGSSLW